MTRKVLVGGSAQFTPGSVRHFQYGPRKGIALNVAGEIRAYVNACTHMGGVTDIAGAVLRCRWHQAEFDPATGERLCGQAPEGTRLTPIELVTEGGNLYALWHIEDPFR